MRGRHAHEESALVAILIIVVIGVIDVFVNISDGHPAKIFVYFGLFTVLYLVARIFRDRAWK